MTVRAKGNGKAILCVDDEVIGLSIREMLLESRGYRVFTAENGPDALVLLSSEAIDLVILDYLMPGMNGDVLALKIRELRPDLPLIMLSAYVDLPGEALTAVNKSLTKGEATVVLLEAIEELLGILHAPRSRAVSVE
jgi:CheY-like chemotaxis protein